MFTNNVTAVLNIFIIKINALRNPNVIDTNKKGISEQLKISCIAIVSTQTEIFTLTIWFLSNKWC